MHQLIAAFHPASFQSTLPVWGATGTLKLSVDNYGLFQSTLPVWGATVDALNEVIPGLFQSTLPVWGATCDVVAACIVDLISIHAPRVGSDSFH